MENAGRNAALVRRYFEMWNTGEGALADALLAPDYFDHGRPAFLGPAAVRSLVPRFQRMHPGAQWTVEIVAADEEFVLAHTTIEKRVGGATVASTGPALFRIAGGKVAEQWSMHPRRLAKGRFEQGDRARSSA